MTLVPSHGTRFVRRRAQTRSALITAAQSFLAEGPAHVPVQAVTARADVGIGTFYNHFSSKDELFDAAVEDAVERFATLLDALGDHQHDPAAFFTRSFRITGRLNRAEPLLSRVLLGQSHELSRSSRGIAPRARRDITAAMARGQFHQADVDVAMVVVTGAMLALSHLLHDEPDRDADATVDAVTSHVLIALGMARDEVGRLCAQDLPTLAALAGHGSPAGPRPSPVPPRLPLRADSPARHLDPAGSADDSPNAIRPSTHEENEIP
jgi:AcrR family transcriptional regulator